MTLYKFYSVAIYDAHTYQMVREPEGIYYSLWSNTDPDLIYSFREDGVIQAYRVSENALDTIHILNGFDMVKVGPGEGNIDMNDRFVALTCKRDTDLVIVIFDLQNREIVATTEIDGAWGHGSRPEYVDWVSVSQSGRFTGIMWDTGRTSPGNPFHGHYGVEIYNTEDMRFLRRLVEYGNHGDFCYSPYGEEIFVQFYGHGGTINSFGLEDGHHTVIHTHSDFGYGDAHLSCRNLQRPGWAYLSTDPERGGMILAVKLDGSMTVEFFGHHFSSSVNYTKSPMPVPSPDGTGVMFNSDFGDSTNPELVYVFETSYRPSQIEESLEIPSNVNGNYRVFDTAGRLVMEGKVPQFHNLGSGIYFIKKGSIRRKVLVIK